MSFISKLFLLATAVLVGYIGIKIYPFNQTLPKLNEYEYWGPAGKRPTKEDNSIRPFKISVSDEVIKDLKHRLDIGRPYTPPLEGIQQQYGFNSNLLKDIVHHWRNDYNFGEREKFLNQFPQFKTNIQGLDIHYIHVKPKASPNVRILPLLLLHGWPGSVREFYDIIPILTQTKDRTFAFEIIAPSLPGFGFSQGASKPGLAPSKMAVIFNNLMKRIGHDQFYVQGGDWGAIIVTHMATLFPKNVLGLHSNMCTVMGLKTVMKLLFGSLHPPLVIEKEYEHKAYPLSNHFYLLFEESGYFHIQATKPDTIGVALGQSPIGLAAYILEKFSTGTNVTYKGREDGGLKEKFTYNDLLDNVMFYWLSNSFTTAARIYTEAMGNLEREIAKIPISEEVPCACARMGQELSYFTDWMLKDKYQNLIYTSDYNQGGHFAAFEVPEILANDIFIAIDEMEKLKRSA